MGPSTCAAGSPATRQSSSSGRAQVRRCAAMCMKPRWAAHCGGGGAWTPSWPPPCVPLACTRPRLLAEDRGLFQIPTDACPVGGFGGYASDTYKELSPAAKVRAQLLGERHNAAAGGRRPQVPGSAQARPPCSRPSMSSPLPLSPLRSKASSHGSCRRRRGTTGSPPRRAATARTVGSSTQSKGGLRQGMAWGCTLQARCASPAAHPLDTLASACADACPAPVA